MNPLILDSIPKNVKVVAVSKLQPSDRIRELHLKTGHLDFGENYLQEATPKMVDLKDLNLRWHFIGRLQKNKLRGIVGNFDYIHSVDSPALIQKISEIALEKKAEQKILLQVNLSKEETKGGFEPRFLEENFCNWVQTPFVKIVGLMTMPPLTSSVVEPTENYFSQLRQLAVRINVPELSMGTSSDYQLALREGATMIRLGTILFGNRPSEKS